jgi:ABC-type multidrug transport system permease subunit
MAVAFLRRDWLIARSYRLPFLMNLVGSAFILIVIFQVSKLIGGTALSKADGLSHGYFSFAVVGTVVIQIVVTASQSFVRKLRDEQTTGTLEALLSAPSSPGAVILGSGLYNIAQSFILAVAVLALAAPLGLKVVMAPGWLLLSVVVFCALVMQAAEVGVLVAAFTVVFKQGSTLSGLIATGLSLLGGVWYPVNSLPGPVRDVAQALPFTWGLTCLRGTLLSGHFDSARFAGALATAVVGLPVALGVFRVAVDRARVLGSLAQY